VGDKETEAWRRLLRVFPFADIGVSVTTLASESRSFIQRTCGSIGQIDRNSTTVFDSRSPVVAFLWVHSFSFICSQHCQATLYFILVTVVECAAPSRSGGSMSLRLIHLFIVSNYTTGLRGKYFTFSPKSVPLSNALRLLHPLK